jgi:hypothetical protein
MRRAFAVISLCLGIMGQASVAFAAPPEDPSITGQCVAETALEGAVPPEDPSVSFPFVCPPPPPFRGEAP